jgi:iduronate 2-sulfatase
MIALRFAPSALLVALAGALGAPQAVGAVAAPATHPNVLFVVVDDLNLALGCYGNRTVKSPNLDRLAARGTRFDRAYAQYPLCNPSRVSFLSGRRPETSGVYVLNIAARTALPDAVMLPQFFRQQGYYTAGAGKIFHSVKMSDQASWDSYNDGSGEDDGEKAAIQSRYGGGDGRPAWHVLAGDGAKTRDGLNARAIKGLIAEKAQEGKPFFLALGLHKPHLPWTAPKRYFDLYPDGSITVPRAPELNGVPPIALQTELSGFAQPDSRAGAIRAYYACISFIDHELGQVLDELDRRDLTRNTLVVFFSDHGFHLGDHGGLWAKLSAFDAATRVPLLLAGPGVPAGHAVATPVELIDVYPTLVDLAGFAAPRGLEGKSLRSTFTQPHAPGHAFSLVYHYDVAGKRDVAGRTVIAPQWRYTEWDGGRSGRELYWRPTDPDEYHNRSADPQLADSLRSAEKLLRALPTPKAGPANRPRALDPDAKGKNSK